MATPVTGTQHADPLATELPDLAHDQLRQAIRHALTRIDRLEQQLADQGEAATDTIEVTGNTDDGWTWTRYDKQGRALAKADKPYTRRSDAERGGQRANPGIR